MSDQQRARVNPAADHADDPELGWPTRLAAGGWIAVVMTSVVWWRASEDPTSPWTIGALLVVVVPGMVVLLWMDRRARRRRDARLPLEDLPATGPRTFHDLPAVQKVRLVAMLVSAVFLVLMLTPLVVLSIRDDDPLASYLPLLAIELASLAGPAILWWWLLHPSRRTLRSEQRLQRSHPSRMFVPVLVVLVGGWVSGFVYQAGGGSSAALGAAFVVNAVAAALILVLDEQLRTSPRQGPTDRPIW